MFEKILVAHDGSNGAWKAFEAALDLAARLRASLHIISVEEDLPRYAETMTEIDAQREVEDTYYGQLGTEARQRAARRSVPLECTIVSGHEVRSIVDFAWQGGFDLLVVGFKGHSAIYEHLWGGTSHNLARVAHCSVLVVK
jgi:nucleotide-binding universal stress UspA family protein